MWLTCSIGSAGRAAGAGGWGQGLGRGGWGTPAAREPSEGGGQQVRSE
jgi:hypothetical protein